MKSLLILTTLFAGSLAAVVPGLDDILPPIGVDCVAADLAIQAGLLAVRPMLPDTPRMEDALKAGTAAFKHEIGCGPAPPEPEPVPEGEQIDCSANNVDKAIGKGREVLKAGFKVTPPRYEEAVEEGIRVFRKTLGCKEQAEVMARGI
ncbi:hypothetical protein BB8028_0003g08680 [Beauveria bassiana]|uniref:Uncharacterized protein n=2 Tax=Beauveria bassiana TaxID=176275 RepID=A0A0A2VXE6_BEABA|nr:hypothetical protein BBAD15_g1930 [Beauveria bassiana D1-5]PQK12251.1 hypothetical protein BB8028_0003g08680 [Beauveria bassiana]